MSTQPYEPSPTAPDANDWLGGNYLRKEDLAGPTHATVADVRAEAVQGDARKRLVVEFTEIAKPLILNKTNTRLLCAVFGSSDTARWRGPVMLVVDPRVEYAGKQVGGIRVLPVENAQAPANGNPNGESYHF